MAKTNKEKRVPKGDVKLKLQLNAEQKSAKETILNNEVTLIMGKAGTGKTLVGCQAALTQLFKREVNRIFIARPIVTNEKIGTLPGEISDKLDPFMQPIYDNFYALYPRENIDKLLASGDIEIAPVGFMRGRTFTDAFIIIDEAQNLTHEQMEMVVTRLGKGSTMVICGDIRQSDLDTRHCVKGLEKLVAIAEKGTVDGLGHVQLTVNHRADIVAKILEEYDKIEITRPDK